LTAGGEADVPQLICDVCLLRIEHHTAGNVLFRPPDGDPPGDGTVVFVHKGDCDRAYERVHGGHPWHEIEAVLLWLEDGLGFDRKARREAAQRVAGYSINFQREV
jgi:hypothetical protein